MANTVEFLETGCWYSRNPVILFIPSPKTYKKGHQECFYTEPCGIPWCLVSYFFSYENSWFTVSWSFSIPGTNWIDSIKNRKEPWCPWTIRWRKYPNGILLWLVVKHKYRSSTKKIICKSSGQYKYCCWPVLSVEENDLNSGNIKCDGGHKRYKRRSVVTDYQSNCITVTVFISFYIYIFHCASFICPKPKSAVYGTKHFITTGSFAFPFSFASWLARMKASHQLYPEPRLGWLPDYMLHHKTDVLLVQWPNMQIMVIIGVRVTKAAINYSSWIPPCDNKVINLKIMPYLWCLIALRYVLRSVTLKPCSYMLVSILLEF